MATEPKATKNLTRATNLTVNRMLAAVKKARASFFKSATEILEKPEAWSDTGRAGINDKADAIFRGQLAKELNRALQALAEAAAESGNSVALKETGDAVPRFSKEYLADYLSRVTPKNAPSLAAVYTASMSESAKVALRQTVVTVFTTAAAAGLSTRERMKLFQSEWALLSKDNDPFRFVDKAGRRWENARYVQMLARTTAQRVQTAAFCDSMLQGGFPLARISNDSGHLTCGTCSEWQGRLIDLSTGHKLKGGTYTLSEARAAGVFHPNCTHRLEFVPLSDYPDHLWKTAKDTIGEPDAFGRERPSSHAGLPTKAQAEAHEKAVESAAKERALEDAKRRDAAIAKARAELEAAQRDKEALEAQIKAEEARVDEALKAEAAKYDEKLEGLWGEAYLRMLKKLESLRRTLSKPIERLEAKRNEALYREVMAKARLRLAERGPITIDAERTEATRERLRKETRERLPDTPWLEDCARRLTPEDLALLGKASVWRVRKVDGGAYCRRVGQDSLVFLDGRSQKYLSGVNEWSSKASTFFHELGHAKLNAIAEKHPEVFDELMAVMRHHKQDVFAKAKAYERQPPKTNTKTNLYHNQHVFRGAKDWPGSTPKEQRRRANKLGKHATLADTLCALSEGKDYGGHERGYYRHKPNQAHETVANLTAMRYTHNALMKRIVGALAEDVETLLGSYAPEE